MLYQSQIEGLSLIHISLKVLSKEFTSGKRKLPVVYEDKDVIFINKPTGMLSQKAKPEDISANEYILAYLIAKGELTESSFRTFRPSICNRLDRNTSGLLAAGKTLKGLQEMAKEMCIRDRYSNCPHFSISAQFLLPIGKPNRKPDSSTKEPFLLAGKIRRRSG